MTDATDELPFDLDAMRRQSGLRIDRDGTWWFRGEPMQNQRVVELFERGLRVDDAGEVQLHVGDQWCYVDVDETAYVVRRARDEGKGEDAAVILVLNDHTEEPLDPSTLMVLGDEELYCRVDGGRCPARFLRDAYHHVAHWLAPGPDGGYVVRAGGREYPVERLDAPPGPLWPGPLGDESSGNDREGGAP